MYHFTPLPTRGNFFFALVKTIDTNIAIIGNFVLVAKNSSNVTGLYQVPSVFIAQWRLSISASV